MRHPVRTAIDKFSLLFGLEEDAWIQDWEIECADPKRVQEYLDAYQMHAKTEDEKFTLMALILGSYEEYHGLEQPDDLVWRKIKSILESDIEIHRDHVNYYSCDDTEVPDEWFPITELIRTIKRGICSAKST